MENWKDIHGYENLYQVSDLGRVKSVKRNKILKNSKSSCGYYVIELYCNGKNKMFRINRLVAQAFIPNPENKTFVNHIDGNKLNNHVDNLEWCTAKENMIHASKTKLLSPSHGEKHYISKLTENDVLEIRSKYIPKKYSHNKLAKEYCVDYKTIYCIINNLTWKHI